MRIFNGLFLDLSPVYNGVDRWIAGIFYSITQL
jgi:hypothetical protein